MNFADTSITGLNARNVLDFFHLAREKDLYPHSLVVLKEGKTVLDVSWAPYDSGLPHMLFSLSKSFLSCAAGFAVAEGLLAWDSRVTDVLANDVPENADSRLKEITLHHLLSMSSGLDPQSDTATRAKGRDWAREILSFQVLHTPGEVFHYNSMGSYLVSCMVQKAAGQTIRDYLMPRLFTPLAIDKPIWDMSPDGVCFGGFGLNLSARDTAKFGQLLLQKGVWEDKQLLPRDWVDRATRRQTDTSKVEEHPDWAAGYGYQFWMTRENRYRGDGMFGQVMMVEEKRQLVVVMTAGTRWMGHQMNAIHDTLLSDNTQQTHGDQMELKAGIASLGYPCCQDDGRGEDFSGVYVSGGKRVLRVDLRSDGMYSVQLHRGRDAEPLNVLLDRGKPHLGEMASPRPGAQAQPYLGSYGHDQGCLKAQVLLPQGPYAWMATLEKTPEGLKVTTRGVGSDEGERVYEKRGNV